MRRLIFGLIIVLLGGSASAQLPAVEKSVFGDWLANSGDAVIRIYPDGEEAVGRVVWAGRESSEWWQGEAAAEIPWHNRREAKKLKHGPTVGVVLMKGMKNNGEGLWQGGRIFNVINGKIYGCQINLESPDVLKLRGYVATPLFGGSVLWTRLTDEQRQNMPNFPNRFENPETWNP